MSSYEREIAAKVVDDVFATVVKNLVNNQGREEASRVASICVVEEVFATAFRNLGVNNKKASMTKSVVGRSSKDMDRSTITRTPTSPLSKSQLEELYVFLETTPTTPEEKVLAAKRVIFGRKFAPRIAHLKRNAHNQMPRHDLVRVDGFLDERKQLWYELPNKKVVKVPARDQKDGEKPVGVLRDFKYKLFVEEQTGIVWIAMTWKSNIFHKSGHVVLISNDSFVHANGIGSSELVARKEHVNAGRIHPGDCLEASYNFYDSFSVGFQKHLAADVMPTCFFCKKIGA
eukprot:c35628_g1_i1.p1 GENE.c35628_g1_i1~~c35628_g1_i1.p1  ORF type:complete len:287 (+),score=62.55 c35628_g1_i1:43-903(+)